MVLDFSYKRVKGGSEGLWPSKTKHLRRNCSVGISNRIGGRKVGIYSYLIEIGYKNNNRGNCRGVGRMVGVHGAVVNVY